VNTDETTVGGVGGGSVGGVGLWSDGAGARADSAWHGGTHAGRTVPIPVTPPATPPAKPPVTPPTPPVTPPTPPVTPPTPPVTPPPQPGTGGGGTGPGDVEQELGAGPWPDEPMVNYSQRYELGRVRAMAVDDAYNLWLLDGDRIGVLRPGDSSPRWTSGVGQAAPGFGWDKLALGSTVICGGSAGRAYVGYSTYELDNAFIYSPGRAQLPALRRPGRLALRPGALPGVPEGRPGRGAPARGRRGGAGGAPGALGAQQRAWQHRHPQHQ
jgi:hypothetical protein